MLNSMFIHHSEVNSPLKIILSEFKSERFCFVPDVLTNTPSFKISLRIVLTKLSAINFYNYLNTRIILALINKILIFVVLLL